MSEEIRKVLVRDLITLRKSLRSYPSEDTIWTVPPGITNSAGTLALHLVGNLQHYVGALLGGIDYQRDRVAEFSDRGAPLNLLEHRIEAAIRAVNHTLTHVEDRDLDAEYPASFGDLTVTTRLFLTHLVSHTAYHLGQIDYHRRLITGVNQPVGLPMGGLDKATLSGEVE